MPNPLDSIWQAYALSRDAHQVVRRAPQCPDTERARLLNGTSFELAETDQAILDLLDLAAKELDHQTVMFLYATFEAVLRDHVIGRGKLLAVAAQPGPEFGIKMEAWFVDLCKETRLDRVVDLFEPWAGQNAIAQVGTIRKYRHWLAHGRRGAVPPTVKPQFAYTLLSEFLRRCGLA